MTEGQTPKFRTRLSLALLMALTAAFLFGLQHLFHLRFEAGDIYPAYSSLRADPLGTKALYESFDRLVPARRNYRPLFKLVEGRGTTLMYLGVEYRDLWLTPAEFRALEHFAADGGRLVIALHPHYQKPLTGWSPPRVSQPPPGRPTGGKKPAPPAKPRGMPSSDEDEYAGLRATAFTERWGLDLGHAELARGKGGSFEPALARCRADALLPETLACHTALHFGHPTNAWRVVYARDQDHAVVIERELGAGSIVLLADSYPFSNEAMRHDRHPDLLAWIVGSSREVVFDETHLGVLEDAGVATLARHYRLHGLALALLVLAALFIWKNSATFPPPYEGEPSREEAELVTGRESAAGFVNLLRRYIRPSELLAACVAEWRKTCAHGVSTSKLQAMQAVIDAENRLEPRQRNPVETYRRFWAILSRSATFTGPAAAAGPRAFEPTHEPPQPVRR